MEENLKVSGMMHILKLNIHILGYFGLLRNDSQLWKSAIFHFILIFTVISGITYSCGSCIEAYITRDDPKMLINGLVGALFSAKAITKITTLTIFRKKLLDMVPHFEEFGSITDSQWNTVNKNLQWARKFVISIWTCYALTNSSVLMGMSPPTDIPDTDVFVPAWQSTTRYAIPFQSARSPYYPGRAAYCIVVSFLVLQSNYLVNTFIFLLIIYHTTHLEVLVDAIQNANQDVKDAIMNKDTSNEDKEELDDMTYENEMYNYLNRCIKKHQALIENFENLDTVVKPMAITDTFIAAILIASVASIMTVATEFEDRFLFISILVFTITEYGMFCWVADGLIDQSFNVGEAAYACTWYKETSPFKKSVQLIIMRAQTPLKFSVGPFGTMSLELYGSILNSAYSYYTVVRELVQ